MAFFAARKLSELGLSPVVVDAREVRMKAHRPRQKSDTRDAVELCEGLRRGLYRAIVHVPPERIEHLRNTLSRRRHFVRLGTAEINAAKKMLRSAGLSELSRQHLGTRRAWQRLLKALASHPQVRSFVELHRRAWQSAMEQKSGLREEPRRTAGPLPRRPREAQDRAGRGRDRGPDGDRGLFGRHTLSERQARRQLRGPGPADLPVGRNEPPGPHHQDGLARAARHARAGGCTRPAGRAVP